MGPALPLGSADQFACQCVSEWRENVGRKNSFIAAFSK